MWFRPKPVESKIIWAGGAGRSKAEPGGARRRLVESKSIRTCREEQAGQSMPGGASGAEHAEQRAEHAGQSMLGGAC